MGYGFTYNIKQDAKKKIKYIFWANGANGTFCSAYKFFGDVVTFNTTYKTNYQGLIFCAFVGCNHYGQTTLFGCGFPSNEKSELFEQLFNKQLKAMSCGPPRGIITDQYLAMTEVIKKIHDEHMPPVLPISHFG